MLILAKIKGEGDIFIQISWEASYHISTYEFDGFTKKNSVPHAYCII